MHQFLSYALSTFSVYNKNAIQLTAMKIPVPTYSFQIKTGLKQQQNILFISTERPRHPWLFIVTGTKSAFFPSQLSASINISLAKSLASINIPEHVKKWPHPILTVVEHSVPLIGSARKP